MVAALGGLPPDALKEILDEDGSRGVESIFNAFIRAIHDAYGDRPADPVTQRAFENMWSEQLQSGSSAEEEFPEFRNNIYTNAGHMWAFLAMTLYEKGNPPWVNN